MCDYESSVAGLRTEAEEKTVKRSYYAGRGRLIRVSPSEFVSEGRSAYSRLQQAWASDRRRHKAASKSMVEEAKAEAAGSYFGEEYMRALAKTERVLLCRGPMCAEGR